MIRIVDARKQREPLLTPGRCFPKAALVERSLRLRTQCERTKLEAVEGLGQRGRLDKHVAGRTDGLDVGPREECTRLCLGPVRGELEGFAGPLLDQIHVQPDRPHRRADGRLEREEGVGVRPFRIVERALDSSQERLSHSLAVVAKRLDLTHLPPGERALVRVATQISRSREELQGLVDLVPTASEHTGATEPVHGPRPQALELVSVVRPDKVDVLGLRGLGVVVGEERGTFVAS